MEKAKQVIDGGVAVIIKNNRHFLIRQSKNKPLAGKWRHPGGSFKKGETPKEGIKREVKEETGFDVKVEETPLQIEKNDYLLNYFGFYKAKLIKENLSVDEKEIDDYGWFTPEEIAKLDLMKGTKSFYKNKYKLW